MARVSSKGAIIIPAEIREEFGIKPGDEVDVTDDGEYILLIPRSEDPVRALRGIVRRDPHLTEALLEEHRWEREREERKIAEDMVYDLQRKLEARSG